MNAVCVVCAATSAVDQHHPAGRRHIPGWLVPLCKRCHLDAHRLLASGGVPLGQDITGLDRLRVGLLALCQLGALSYAHQGAHSQARLWLSLGAVLAAWLDEFGPVDRPGRVMPDPRKPYTPPVLRPALRLADLDNS